MIAFLCQCILALTILSVVLVSVAVIAIIAGFALIIFVDSILRTFKVLSARFIRSN